MPDEHIDIEIDGVGKYECKKGTSLKEIWREVRPENAPAAVAAVVNDHPKGLSFLMDEPAKVKFLSFEHDEGARVYWHTSSHILAQAVKRLYPGVKLGIGPAIENGFYYDFEFPEPISMEDLESIEQEMKKIVKENIALEMMEADRQQAEKFFREKNEPYKLELVRNLPENEKITFYRQGDFMDLCTGPHLPSTGYLKAFKLTGLAGAYWRGSERNPMLQRIYGISFPTKQRLKDYLQLLEEAKKRDHRKLARDLDLFSLHEEAPGFPFFHSNGMIIWRELENYWRQEHAKSGYQEIKTPLVLDCELWKRSGHWDHYRENMYFSEIDEKEFAIKPMNCPGAMLIYLSRRHSYRDLPLRIAELGQVHRHELSGTLHGLMRVRTFTQDDAHLFMLPEQIEAEVDGIIDMIDRFYRVFGFEYKVELSTRPEKAMGSIEVWERATMILKRVLERRKSDFMISEGEGAFYGPKIDFHLRDCLGRSWQCGTIQLDFQMPERFDLTYIGKDGQKHRPVMIHRVIFGAMERFIALLIEHYGGAFPTWLAPLQVVVLPLTENQHEAAFPLRDRLGAEGFRVEIDSRNEKLGYKIREAQLKKIPYMLVIGPKEVETGRVALRHRQKGDLGVVEVDDFIQDLHGEIRSKRLPPECQ
ncbi:MAG: threonine--tRNA ligase [Dethiobacteria bacterium]